MPREPDDALLSVAQAATLLGVHPNTIRTWTDAGRLSAYRINARGDRRYRRGEVARLLVEDGAAEHAAVAGDAGYTVFTHLAGGLAADPTVASVSRSLVEGLVAELGLSRAAAYVAVDGELTLAAHVGPGPRPPAHRPIVTDRVTVEADQILPLATPRTVLGAVVLDAAEAATIPSGFLAALGPTAATVIAAAQRLTRSRRELRRVRALRSVTKELTGTLDLERVLNDVVDRTRSMFAADRAGIWIFDGNAHPLPHITRGLSETFLRRSTELTLESETIALRAVREGRPLWAAHADRDDAVGEMRAAYAAEGIRTVCIVPLVSRGEPLGAIALYHNTDRTWPEEEMDLVQAFADQAAVAIQNARLYRSVAAQAARMRSIQDLSARLNRLTDVQAIADAIVAEARTLAEYHDIRVYRVDHDRGVCEPIAFTRRMLEDEPGDPREMLRVAIGEGFTGWAAEHGEPLLVNDALDDERGKTIEGTDDVPESMLVVPMVYEGRTLGVIVLSQLGFNRFTSDDLQTMSIFAGYAAQAIANADTYETLLTRSAELGRRVESQRRLLEINERLLTTLDPESVLETIADGLRDVVAYDNLTIYRVDHGSASMMPVLTREAHAEEVGRYVIPFGRGLMGWAVEHGQPVLANDALADPRALQIPGTPAEPEALCVVPLLSEGVAIGSLNVSRTGGPEVYFSEADFELVKLFAAQASIALRNADTHHAIRQQADTDALTGLGNHGAFQRELAAAIDAASAEPHRDTVTVLMMDLDSFKPYNDRHGHPAGDALLHRVATAIYGAARARDRVYRYGGDEFAMVLTGTTSAQAARLGDRVRRAVNRLTRKDGSQVTITIGVAALPEDATDRPDLIAAADTALYYGKRAGGDRVVRAIDLPDDVNDLRGTLEQLATAALREGDDGVVEHLAEHASALSGARREETGRRGAANHGERIALLAGAVAEAMGIDERDRRDIELAAHLDGLDDRNIARLGAVPALRSAATLLVGRRTMLAEGARRGRRAPRARGARAVHVVTAAALYDELVTGLRAGEASRLDRDEAIEALRRHPATFHADVLDALAGIVGHRRNVARRRRTERREARGAA